MKDLVTKNLFLKQTKPEDIARNILNTAARPAIFTNFRPTSIALIHLVTSIDENLPVVWIDSGFNTDATYRYVEQVSQDFALNLVTYTSRMTSARWQALHGYVPEVASPLHQNFTELVKLEPFKRALKELCPDYWFTGIRKDQTEYRSTQGVLSNGPQGTIKVAPFIDETEDWVDQYILDHDLRVYLDYFDPTKGPEHRECGLQLLA